MSNKHIIITTYNGLYGLAAMYREIEYDPMEVVDAEVIDTFELLEPKLEPDHTLHMTESHLYENYEDYFQLTATSSPIDCESEDWSIFECV